MGLLTISICVLCVIEIFRVGAYIGTQVYRCIDVQIEKEQERELARAMEIVDESQRHMDELHTYVDLFKNDNMRKISTEDRKRLAQQLIYLEEDARRIEKLMNGYYTDMTINFYPYKNVQIDLRINALWNTHMIIERIVRNGERIIYDTQINTLLYDQISDDMQVIHGQFGTVRGAQ